MCTCTCCLFCCTSSTDRTCYAFTCDRVQRTSTTSDFFFSPSPQFLTMADLITGVTTSVDDACPRPRSCTEHFDLTADDSQDECLADGMPSYVMACPCRTSTPHRVIICWPVRKRGTCDARHTTQEHKGIRTPTRRELQILGGRIGLFVEWADYIETEGGTWKRNDLSTGAPVRDGDIRGGSQRC